MTACWVSLKEYLIIHSKERSPSWETNRFSASQEIPYILWNPKIHYHQLYLFWDSSIQYIPAQPTSWSSFLILSSHLRLGLPNGLCPSGFHTKFLYMPRLSHIRATCPAYLILLDFITRTILGIEYRSSSSSLCSFLHSIFSPAPCSQTPLACICATTDLEFHINLFNIIHSVHCDYNCSHIPTNAHSLYKITNHPYSYTALTCFSNKSSSSQRH
jgi:hypothetical protein